MANERDCENCKHHREVCKNGKFYRFCESWDCGFEPKEPVRNPDQLDCISRQAVLDVVEKAVTKEVARWSIKELPPVNPQKPICPSAGIDCEDCPAYEPKTGHSFPEGATNKDIFKAIFGYEPATDSVVCNKEDWCGASEPCNYCLNNSDSIGREEDWWNAPYKAEGSKS